MGAGARGGAHPLALPLSGARDPWSPRPMPFVPRFMGDLERFRAELARVTSVPEWLAFKARWFDDQPWPRRTPEALAAARGAPFEAGGRRWTRAPLPDDLAPEARYAYFAALQQGFTIVFPRPEDAPGAGGSRVRFQCPACEIFSDDAGEDACPSCGRPLIRLRLDPPPRR